MTSFRSVNKRQFRMVHLLALMLICIAGLRQVGFDRDSLQYLDSYEAYAGLLHSDYLSREPGFWGLAFLTRLLHDEGFRLLLIAYAAVSIGINVAAIKKLTPYPLLTLICFAFLYFPLHTMTQIRAGVACAILLLAIPDIAERRLKPFLVKVGLAMLFHYSAIVIVVLYLIKPGKINFRLYALLPVAALCISLVNGFFLDAMNLLAGVLPEWLGYKILMYISILEEEGKTEINLFSMYYASVLLIYYICLFNIGKFKSRYDTIFLKILCWSLVVYYVMSFLPVIAFRVSEIFGVVIIFVIPALAYRFANRNGAMFCVAGYLAIIFVNNVFVHELFNF